MHSQRLIHRHSCTPTDRRMHTHTYTHACTHTHTHTHARTHTACMHAHACMHMHTQTHTGIYIYTQAANQRHAHTFTATPTNTRQHTYPTHAHTCGHTQTLTIAELEADGGQDLVHLQPQLPQTIVLQPLACGHLGPHIHLPLLRGCCLHVDLFRLPHILLSAIAQRIGLTALVADIKLHRCEIAKWKNK